MPVRARGCCRSTSFACWAVAGAGCVLSIGSALAQVTLTPVIAPGQSAPGTAPGVVFQSAAGSGISIDGLSAAFVATVQGPGVTSANNTGWWQGPVASGVSGLGLSARTGSLAPLFDVGPVLNSFSDLVVGNGHESLALTQLTGPGISASNDRALCIAPAVSSGRDPLELVIQESEGPVGLDGAIVATITSPRLWSSTAPDALSTAAWAASLSGPGVTSANGSALMETDLPRGLFASVRPLFRAGPLVTAPGLSATLPFDFRGPEFGYASDSWVARVKLSGPGITTGNGDDGLVAGATGIFSTLPPVLFARDAAQAPGLPAGVVYELNSTFGGVDNLISGSVANAAGARVAVLSKLAGPSVDATNDFALFVGQPGQLWLAVRSGQPAPRGPGIINNMQQPFLNSRGQAMLVALFTQTSPAGQRGILISEPPAMGGSGRTTRVVVRTGDPVPGSPTLTFSNVFPRALTGSGMVAFTATVTGPGVSPGVNDLGLFAGHPGAIQKLVRIGETISGKVVRGIRFDAQSRGNADGRLVGLSDTGHIVFALDFTDFTSQSFRGVVPMGGACCDGSACTITLAADCAAVGTRFAGPGTTCNPLANPASPCCKADFNQADGLNVQDIFNFLAAWFSAEPRADFSSDGQLGVNDIFDFLAAWFAGC
jgi:hypothetical protein